MGNERNALAFEWLSESGVGEQPVDTEFHG
jgi:hypothetical protein